MCRIAEKVEANASSREHGKAKQSLDAREGKTRCCRAEAQAPPQDLRTGICKITSGSVCGVGCSKAKCAKCIRHPCESPSTRSSTTHPCSYLTCIACLDLPDSSHLPSPPAPHTPLILCSYLHSLAKPTHQTQGDSQPGPCCLRAACDDWRKVRLYRDTWCISTLSRDTRWRRYVRATGTEHPGQSRYAASPLRPAQAWRWAPVRMSSIWEALWIGSHHSTNAQHEGASIRQAKG